MGMVLAFEIPACVSGSSTSLLSRMAASSLLQPGEGVKFHLRTAERFAVGCRLLSHCQMCVGEVRLRAGLGKGFACCGARRPGGWRGGEGRGEDENRTETPNRRDEDPAQCHPLRP